MIASRIPRNARIRMMYKMIHLIQLEEAEKRCKIKKGANYYAFEYMKSRLNRYVKIKDVQEYCNKRTKEETGHPLGDPPMAFEILRKDKLPLEWSEIQYRKIKYVKYTPHIKNNLSDDIIALHKHKKEGFDKLLIERKLAEANYRCSITGITMSALAADHFIPKEKGGLSTSDNCVIINKILNEQKNKKMPIEWFCETLLTNFMRICKRVGILEECKSKLVVFINNF